MKKLEQLTGFKNVYETTSGFYVTIMRGRIRLSQQFPGRTTESFEAAVRYRDSLLRQLPDKRIHRIPPRVLRSIGLAKPAVGVSRNTETQAYLAHARVDGQVIARRFPWRDCDETEAYRAAIAFRRFLVETKAAQEKRAA